MSTLITKKYTYEKLRRKETNGKRKYQTPTGKPVPSVTTILDATSDKSFLIEWRKRIGHQKAQEITTEAANNGTRMHKYLESYIETGIWLEPGSNPYAQKAHKMATIIKENALVHVDEIWGSEVPLYIPHLYAGTTDVVGQYKGNAAIIDFKQSNKFKKIEWVTNYFLQMVAYAECHNEVHGTNIREGHVFMCTKELEYQQFDIWPDEYDEWRHAWYDKVYEYYEKYAD
jgi:genome maintenance exonuclease 1